MRRLGLQTLGFLLALVLAVFAPAHAWEQWGGDAAGTRFSPLQQITPANVDRLVKAWEFHTGDLARPAECRSAARAGQWRDENPS